MQIQATNLVVAWRSPRARQWWGRLVSLATPLELMATKMTTAPFLPVRRMSSCVTVRRGHSKPTSRPQIQKVVSLSLSLILATSLAARWQSPATQLWSEPIRRQAAPRESTAMEVTTTTTLLARCMSSLAMERLGRSRLTSKPLTRRWATVSAILLQSQVTRWWWGRILRIVVPRG